MHNRCQMVPPNEHFLGYLSPVCQVLWNSSVANLSSLSYFTLHFPQCPPLGSTSHSTPDVGSPTWSRQSALSFTNRCHMRPMRSYDHESLPSELFVPGWLMHLHWWNLVSNIISMESLCLIERQGIAYRQMSTVIANWPLIHVPNTMFCEEGSNYIRAITVSSGSQCAYRFCVFFSSFGWESPMLFLGDRTNIRLV